MKLFNTLTRKKEIFQANRTVYIYTCGPTVYDEPHLGNWRSFLFADFLCSYLEHKKYKVYHVLNITDVDDKTIKNSQEAGQILSEYTNVYKQSFFNALDLLKFRKAEVYPEATHYVEKMAEIIKVLLEKNYAYKSNDGSVYFRIQSFKAYENLFQLNLKQTKDPQLSESEYKKRLDVDEYDKENYGDFVLWKSYQESDGDVYWEFPFLAKGRPGWHIECSAMALSTLPYPFDIHTGGVDNLFPHHVNEIAQTLSYKGDSTFLARYWLHVEHLNWTYEKISKSKNHRLTLSFFLEKGYSVEELRFFLLRFHYRSKISLGVEFERLKEAKKNLQDIYEFLARFFKLEKEFHSNEDIKAIQEAFIELKAHFYGALDNDLNVSEAFDYFFIWMDRIKKKFPLDNIFLLAIDFDSLYNFLKELDSIFKLNFSTYLAKDLWVNNFILVKDILKAYQKKKENLFEFFRIEKLEELHKQRERYRNAKFYKEADQLKQEIQALGYLTYDTLNGTSYRFVNKSLKRFI